MPGQATWTQRANKKLVDYVASKGAVDACQFDAQWRLEGRIGDSTVSIRQDKPRGRLYVNDEPATSQAKAVALLASLTGPRADRLPKISESELDRRARRAAATLLERKGYVIVEEGRTCEAGTIDLVARDGEWVVFVETNARLGAEKGLPAEGNASKKRDRMGRIAALFLAQFDVVDVPIRFDVVSLVVLPDERALIRHHLQAHQK